MMKREELILLVIDYQDALLAKIPVSEDIVAHGATLAQFARSLEIPILWTEQYPKGLGKTEARISALLAGCPVIEKVSFDCFGTPGFKEALEKTGRKQVLVAGVETHVCVMQTVLSARALGYEVFVARDAVGSRTKGDYKAGISRMQAHGAEIVTTEMAIFETLRVAGTPDFKKILPLVK